MASHPVDCERRTRGLGSVQYSEKVSTRDVPEQIGDLPKIGRPANSALQVQNIKTLAEVAAFGKKRLLALHGVGPKAVRILGDALAERGIDWAE